MVDVQSCDGNEVMACNVAIMIAVFMAIALYNAIELTLFIFATFKRRQGLYFYSILAATTGIIPHNIGLILKLYHPSSPINLRNTVILTGWCCMITGQSLVLYSRLHLINRSREKKSRWVLYMIIVDAISLHLSGFVLVFGSANAPNPEPFLVHFPVYEKTQLIIFFVQETIISGLYLYRTTSLLRAEGGVRGHNAKQVLRHLLLVNVAVIVMDISLLAIEFAGLYNIEIVYKATVYSIKLKMEFSILNKLIDLFKGPSRNSVSNVSSGTYNSHLHDQDTSKRSPDLRSVGGSATHNSSMTRNAPCGRTSSQH